MTSIDAIEKRFPWSFFGFLLGTISLVAAIGFFYLSKQGVVTNLRFQIEEEFHLVELRETFPNIKILYNDEDILKSEKVIKIIRIRLENSGRTILQSYYDQNLPFGLEFIESTILAVAPISHSGGYLQENLFRDDDEKEFKEGKVLLNKLIIEKESQLTFKIYLLQEKAMGATVIKALGKISGMDNIQVVPFDPARKVRTVFERETFEIGAIYFASGYFGIIAAMVTVLPIIFFFEGREKRAKRKRCNEYIHENEKLTDEQKEFILSYGEGWRQYYLPTIRTLVSGGEALDISELVPHPGEFKTIFDPFGRLWGAKVRRLLPLRWEPSVFTVTEGKISLNVDNREVLIRFLRKFGELKESNKKIRRRLNAAPDP